MSTIKMYEMIILFSVLVFGCAAASKMNGLSIGMSKQEAMAVMGDPVSTSANDNIEFLLYNLAENPWQGVSTSRDYFVKIINGKVDSYGRMGDFDFSKPVEKKVKAE
jgi:hypothetical protein